MGLAVGVYLASQQAQRGRRSARARAVGDPTATWGFARAGQPSQVQIILYHKERPDGIR